MEVAIFSLLALVATCSALNILVQKHPIHGALSLIVTFVALAGIYLQMHAEFVAVMQVVVYTGAIMVLFIFVIMLLNAKEEESKPEKVRLIKYLGLPLAVLLIVELLSLVQRSFSWEGIQTEAKSIDLAGNTQLVGRALYSQYVLPLEVTSLLLLVAIIGAIVMAKKDN